MARLIKRDSSNFTVVSNQLIRDSRLSWKARGIFSYLWSQANNWKFYVSEVATHAIDGVKSLRSGLDELEKYGYLTRVMSHDDNGDFDGMDWILDDKPSQNGVDAKKEQNSKKKCQNTSDAKGVQRKRRPTQKGTLRNNNVKKEQLKERTTVRKEDIYSSGTPEPQDTKDKKEERIPIEEVKKILGYLNSKTGAHYKSQVKANEQKLNARWNEGYRFDDFKKVIDTKVNEWGNDEHMKKYLRPVTLFGTKFEDYVNQQSIQNTSVSTGGGYAAHGPKIDDSYLNDLPF